MLRPVLTAVAAFVALSAALAAATAPTAAARPARAWTESFSAAPAGWRFSGPAPQVQELERGGGALRMRASRRAASGAHQLPGRPWALSMNLRARPGSSTAVELGKEDLRPVTHAWVHLEAVGGRSGVIGSLGGRSFELAGPAARSLRLRVRRGELLVDDVVATPAGDPGLLLLHRMAALQSRVPAYRFLLGADRHDRLHLKSRYWTRGFLAGGLWEAGSLLPRGNPLARAAVERTLDVLGGAVFDSHDQGFIHENSSLAAYRRQCRRRASRRSTRCRSLRTIGLAAADRTLALAATNRAAGTLPTRSGSPSETESDTIIDSMMNLPLLYWASELARDPRYREVAAHHARRVAQVLVRPDGSTAQSAHFDRRTGTLLRVHSHQGIGPETTWARGQGWAIYGFTTSAAALDDPRLLDVAERTAGFVADHLPASGVPPYDYSAPVQYSDTSAAAITAAALFRLDDLCRRRRGACARPAEWRPLAERLLGGALDHVRRSEPIGYLDDQVATFGGRVRWDDRAELAYGLRYALEALRRSRGQRLPSL